MKLVRWMMALILGLVSACGGGDGGTGPGNPPPPATQTLASVRFPSTTLSLTAGQVTTLTPQAIDQNGGVIANASGFSFSSSDGAVVEVAGGGDALGLSAGSATVTATLTRDGVTASATVTITVSGSLPTTATVTAGSSDNTFTPQTLVVARNAVVTWGFGTLLHNVTFGAATGAPSNIPNSSTTQVARTFATAGDFPYDCTLHSGMSGTVRVR